MSEDTTSKYIKLGSPLDQLLNRKSKWPFELDENTHPCGGLVQPSWMDLSGTGNIVIMGSAGTGKSTLAMQIAAQAVMRDKGRKGNPKPGTDILDTVFLYAAYFTLEETRGQLFSKMHHFGWGDWMVPVDMPLEERPSSDIQKLAEGLDGLLERGHYCRQDPSRRGGQNPSCNYDMKKRCDLRLFCEHKKKRPKPGEGVVLLPKLLPFSFGNKSGHGAADQLFLDRFHQIETFLEAAEELRDPSEADSQASSGEGRTKQRDIRIVCVDSLNVLGRGGMTRDHLASLFELFKRHRVIGVFILENTKRGLFTGEGELDEETIEFLADTVIELTREEENGYLMRHFQIKKARYQQHVLGKHPYKIRSYPQRGEIEPKDAYEKRIDELKKALAEAHPDSSLFGLRTFPSTHCMKTRRVHFNGARPDPGKIWTDGDLDEKLIKKKPEEQAGKPVFAIVGSSTSGKSILARNFLLQGILEGQGHSLMIELAANCDPKCPDEFFLTNSNGTVSGYQSVKAKEDLRKDLYTYLSAYEAYSVDVDLDGGKGSFQCNIHSVQEQMYISLALRPGFLLPEEFFEIVLLIFEWVKQKKGQCIERVVLYDVSAIGHSYPMLRNSPTTRDLFLSNFVQFLRTQGVSLMMVGSRTGMPESDAVVKRAEALADYTIKSSPCHIRGEQYITYSGPGAVRQQLENNQIRAIPGVLRKGPVEIEGQEKECFRIDFDETLFTT